jgi:hypothetical protein
MGMGVALHLKIILSVNEFHFVLRWAYKEVLLL